ncbi:S8 family peptidase [Actinoplanes sp. RD1]|uniref:S8 family peptidase n=1 Tax=Actinoplanes sp. RD1 TaxID=3064538 RepID=UPI002741692D|nr:S8 family peptidase [Actinoplanes sp. RD1]
MTKFDALPRLAVVAVVAVLSPCAIVLPSPGRAEAAPTAGQAYEVTLVTGDRVKVSSPHATTAAVQPGPGREHLTFATTSAGGHLRVIPSDAARLVRTGRVDRRLFDVTELIRLGYDDARRPDVPLIVRSATAAQLPKVTTTMRARGAEPTRDLAALRSVAMKAPKRDTPAVWPALKDSTVQTVWLDGKRQPLLDRSVPQIGAPAAWQAGLTGEGMTVAVLDTGVDESHPDLAGRVTSRSFTDGETDTVGHGTHVASTIAGDGTASGGRYKGVAPGARILSGKVCAGAGCDDSAILAGMQWAAVEQHAKVINLSLGGPDTASIDPLEEAVGTLSAQTGALFVIAAGNDGPAAGTVGSPGSADAALTVAAVDRDDAVADFSSRGPRTGDGFVKPDIAAPGVGIVAARATGTEMGTPDAQFPGSYVAADGTSMATPHVAGAAVLLAQRHPDWTGAQLKAALTASAERTPGAPTEIGAGRVDVARALRQSVVSEPVSLSYGTQLWPHDNDTAVTKTVTYRNLGPAAVTLDLALDSPAFRLGADTVAVPAGGTAQVSVTADTRALAVGVHQAHLAATSGDSRVVTPVAIEKEPERYQLTIKHIGADGAAAADYFTQIYTPGDGGDFWTPWDASGTVTLRLPKGRFTAGSYVFAGAGVSILFQPELELTKDTTLVFDARDAVRVTQSVDRPDAETRVAEAGAAGAGWGYSASAPTFGDLSIGRSDGGGGAGLTGHVSSVWMQRDSGEDHAGSPYAYFAGDTVTGEELLGGYRRAFTTKDFAAVTETFRGRGPDTVANHWHEATDADGNYVVSGAPRVTAPGVRVSYLTGDPGLRWIAGANIGRPSEWGGIEGNVLHAPARTYRPGQKLAETWGAAPQAMQFEGRIPWFQRYQDQMAVTVPWAGDGGGHSGYDQTQDVTTRLYRGDELIATDAGGAYADGLPAEPARYRVENDTATSHTVLSWTSGASGEVVNLPVFAVRYQPHLDAADTARAGTRDRIPLTPAGQAGAPVTLRALTFEVSFDDGASWVKAPIAGSAATVVYPKGSGWVSTRVRATDSAGGTFGQTVTRAYRYTR